MIDPAALHREFAERVSIQSAQMILLASMVETDAMRDETLDMARDMARRARAFVTPEEMLAIIGQPGDEADGDRPARRSASVTRLSDHRRPLEPGC
jgi:hypothetical protein